MKINLGSPVIVFLTTVADFMILNILFILCCAPVITIGPAVSALYTITMREARHEGGYIFKPFFKAFKNNFKQAFLLSILYLIIGAIFVFGVKFWLEKPEFSTVNQVILVITGVFAVIFIFSLLPLLSSNVFNACLGFILYNFETAITAAKLYIV